MSAERQGRFTGDALAIIYRFAEAIETSDALVNEWARAMFQRLNAMTVKLAALTAVESPGAVECDELSVTLADANAAVSVATGWRDYAIAFGEQIGETILEQHINRPSRWLRGRIGS